MAVEFWSVRPAADPDPGDFVRYIGRVITETRAAENLYWLNCDVDSIEAHRPGKRVEDFLCPSCDRRTQLKAARGGHGRTVSNSATTRRWTRSNGTAPRITPSWASTRTAGGSPTSSSSRVTS